MKKIYVILLLSICSFTIYAQDANQELLKKLVEKQILTQSEADQIAKESTKTSSDNMVEKVRKVFNNTPYLEVGGYGLMLYKYDNTRDSKKQQGKNDLKARVIFLNASGNLTNTLKYFVMFELMDARMYEYYMDWTPMKEVGFKLGQYKVPLSMENPMSLTVLETIQNSRSISSLTGMTDDVMKSQNKINNAGRDIGLQMSGKLFNMGNHDLVYYALGVFQGAGMNTSDKDNVKDFAGTILFEPVKGLRLGGSALFGAATYQTTETDPGVRHVRNRWVASGEFQSDRFYARAEWLNGKDGQIDREGLYGTAKYFILPKKISMVGKVDYYNRNKDLNAEVIDYLAGVDYWFYNKCRVQLNYQYSDYSKKWDQKNSHQVMGQLQIVF